MNNENFEPQEDDKEVNPTAEQWGDLPKVGEEWNGMTVQAVGGVENIDPESAAYLERLSNELPTFEDEAPEDSSEKSE